MDFNKAHQKELAKFERALRRSIAETQARNAMYRMPQSTNFTFSDIVDRCNADSSGLPEYFSDFLRKPNSSFGIKMTPVIECVEGCLKNWQSQRA